MSSIRWRPRFTVLPTSPEVKKSIQIYRFGRSVNPNCFCIKRKIEFLDGGRPSFSGRIFDGGTPSAGGPQIYDGGNP